MDGSEHPPAPKRRKPLNIGGQDWGTEEQLGHPQSPETGAESGPLRCSTPVKSSDDLADITLSDLEDGWDDDDDKGEEREVVGGDPGEKDLSLDYFGLNDESIDEFVSEVEAEEPSLDWLPNEVLEKVFCHLPLQQLLSSCCLVNRRWSTIIRRERFLRWKKRYHLLKSGQHPPTATLIEQLLTRTQMLGPTAGSQLPAPSLQQEKPHPSLVHIAKFVGLEFIGEKVAEGALPVLQQHPRYGCVKQIATLHPELNAAESQCPGVMETITLLVACSRSVQEVHSIIKAILTPPGSEGNHFREPLCDFITVMEVFYCLATLFFALWNRGVLPPRFHYFVFYVLDALERGPSTTSCQQLQSAQQQATGQQSITRYSSGSSSVQLTAEQLLIVHHDYKPSETVKIMAFAGTGKTTTLLHLTQLNPSKHYLYCVYNKSVQEYAKSIFPDNVECRTFHSLAWKSAGEKYWHKQGSLDAYKVSQWIKHPPITYHGVRQGSHFVFSKWVLLTLESFIASRDEQLSRQHVPRIGGELEHVLYSDTEIFQNDFHLVESPAYTAAVVAEAKGIWRRMQDLNDREVRISHDGYFKVFQLQKPTIDAYDCILIDEAQDLTPAIIATIMSQKCPKILVGDPHQQIYGFRGAKNAMALVPADHTLYLTKSFRFGPDIAYVASCILDALKSVRRQTIVGELKPGGVLGETSGQVAVIARTNAGLFTEMVKICDSGQKVRIGFAGGIEKYELKKLLDIHKLLQQRHSEIKDPFIKKFRSFLALKLYAEKASDAPLLGKIKVCEHYLNLPRYVEKIYSLACKGKDLTFADIVFSTAHKSKGLEFPTVKLVDDFVSTEGLTLQLDDPLQDISFFPIDELNLLYVGATRAKTQLLMTPTLVNVLKRAGEHFVYPTVATAAVETTTTTCPNCPFGQLLPDLRLERPQISLNGTPAIKAAGYICKSCSLLTMPSLCL